MAPSQTTESHVVSDKMSPTQENKPPIPTGAGAKKAMEAYFAGTNHLEYRQRSSSTTRSTRTFSRGSTPSRDAANAGKSGASGRPEGAIDPDALKSALKKIPSMEKISIRATPPRSRSISRSNSPLPDEELLDESLPDFYKVTLKPTDRTGSQTRDILLGGNRLSRGATPTRSDVPEFRRVALRRTPSREQLVDEQSLKRSTLKKNTVMETSSTTNLSRSSSFTSLTAINKTVLSSRRNSTATDDQPEFKGVMLKKTGSKPGSRAGSPTKLTKSESRAELAESKSSLKKVETSSRTASRRGSATSETSAEFANVSLKKTQTAKSQLGKFEVEQVSLKPIPVGEEEDNSATSSAGVTTARRERASSVTRQRVLRETKFEANDEEYLDIKSSLDKLKKKEATPVESKPETTPQSDKTATPVKDASPTEDAAAKPIIYRRRKKIDAEVEEAEKVQLKPVARKAAEMESEEMEKVNLRPLNKRLSFTSSIECVKKAAEAEETTKPAPLLRKASFTSSLENIAVGGEDKEKVHLSCFSREMGSNVDLVTVCQDRGADKHEVKLEFQIEGNKVKENEGAVQETIEERLGQRSEEDKTATKNNEDESEEEEEEEIVEEVVQLHKIRKAPSIDGLFQRQDVQAAFTFTLPFQNEEPTAKLSLEIPNLC